MADQLTGVSLSLLAALTWSVAAIFYKKGEVGLNSFESNALRCFLPLVTLILAAIYLNGLSFLAIDFSTLAYTFLATVIALIIGDSLYLNSIKLAGVSIAVPASYTFPIFTSIISYLFLGENISPYTSLGVALTVLGIWLLSYKNRRNLNSNLKAGVIAAISASILWAVGISLFRYILFSYDPFNLTVWRMLILTLALTPFSAKSLRKAKRDNILYLNVGGFFGLGLGGVFLYYALVLIGAAKTSTVSSTTPFFSVLLATLFLKEKLTFTQVLGVASITAGLILVSLF